MAHGVKQEGEIAREMTWAEFLGSPPETIASVKGLTAGVQGPIAFELSESRVELHCGGKCDGQRSFEIPPGQVPHIEPGGWRSVWVHFRCQNCQEWSRTYAILAKSDDFGDAALIKVGEHPPFGKPLPAGVDKLLGDGKALFLKGKRSEEQNLGIGAFAYYRRAVQEHKEVLFDQIIAVSKQTGADASLLDELEKAKTHFQFTRTVDEFKVAIPPELRLEGGHNPLTLLHKALSEGLHDHTDEECLELAGAAREVLIFLADRIDHVLQDKKSLAGAVSKLLVRRQKETTGENAAAEE